MAYGLNKVQLIGRLGSDPELKTTEGGVSLCSFSLATNESYKDQSGNLVERAEWHRCVAWRKGAEVLAQYVRKGQLLYVEGKLETRKYEKDGQDHYSTQIVVNEFVMLTSKGDREQSASTGEPRMPQAAEPNQDDGLPF